MASQVPEKKTDRSRDNAALGADVLAKFAEFNVLIVGLTGIGLEIAKNVILTGPKSVTLVDETPAQIADLGTNYYLKASDVGRPRAAAVHGSLSELNDFVFVSVCPAVTPEVLSKQNIAIFTNSDQASLLRWNAVCREHGVAFIAASVLGVSGSVFVDFGPRFTVRDPDGEAVKSAVITAIEQQTDAASGEKRLYVITDVAKRHGFSDNDHVVFKEVEGLPRLNDGVPRKISQTETFGFVVHPNSGENFEEFGSYTSGGMVTQQKVPTEVTFEPLATRIESPYPADDPTGLGIMLCPDLGKWGRSEQLHAAFQGLEAFRAKHGGLPRLRHADDANEVVALTKQWVEEVSKKEGTLRVEVDEKVVFRVAQLAAAEFHATSTFLSGIVAQEVVKLSGKFTPLRQYFYYDCLEALASPDAEAALPAEEFMPIGSRYDHIIAFFGRTIQQKMSNQKIFLIGCGALGCELLKNFALMGVGCGPEGEIIATDMDQIELSNLSRQFLYRRVHVGTAKSTTSTNEVRKMNPDMKTKSLQIAVGPTTEDVFNDEFWKSRDIIVNALDNVEARNYVDERCVFYCKPMLDSGTLGTKANTQVVVPFETECYRDQNDGADDKDAIPMCTVRELPYLPEHCIEWARSLFAGEFSDSVRGAVALQQNPAEWVANQRANLGSNPQPEAIQQVLETLQAAEAPSFEACVARARMLYERLFYTKIKNITHHYHRDYEKDGAKYWTGRRRFPEAIAFDTAEPLCRSFLEDTTFLLANVFGVELPAEWNSDAVLGAALAKVHVPEWVPAAISMGDESKEKGFSEFGDAATAASNLLKQIEGLIASLGGEEALKNLKLNPAAFEKDDDSNHHIDFITCATNLRARNFKIPESERLAVRVTAGRIIPAIATTTTMITGLVSVEYYKVVGGKKLDDLRNSFINLATNAYSIAEPAGPKRTRTRKHSVTFDGPVRAHPDGFTRWDFWEFKDATAVTPSAIEDFFHKEHGLKVAKIWHEDKSLFIGRLAKHRTERAGSPIVDIFRSVYKREPGKTVLLTVDVSDDASAVRTPPVRLHL